MKFFLFWFMSISSATLLGEIGESDISSGSNRHWVCNGYCFLGGDTPVNPFQPVSSTGATEEEARENIDCGPYQETGIVCKEVNGD